MAKKIILERGAPGSGKSTCAKVQCAKDGNLVRVNRDDLRSMGFGVTKWSPHRETWILATEEMAVRVALDNGFTPIVDSTNLMPERLEHFQQIATQCGVELRICDHTDVPIGELVARDSLREGTARVGRVVIEKLLAQAGMLPKTERNVVICDIDGTLASLEHRKHYIVDRKKADWHSFFKYVDYDVLIDNTANLIKEEAKTNDIWIVSGRPDFHVEGDSVARTGELTIGWLNRHDIPFNHIFMRKAGDKRPDTEVKQDILNKLILRNIPKTQIVRVYDDRPSVIRMWRDNGLEVVDVGPGVEF